MRAVILMVLVMELCNVPAMSGPAASVGVRGLQVELRLNKAAYRVGEAVEITLALTNSSGSAVGVEFPTGQVYDFVVTREGQLVWQWSLGRAFTQAFTTLTLMPKESKVFIERWDQRNPQGQQAPPGKYEMVAVFPAGGAPFMPNRPEGPKVRFNVMSRSVPSAPQHIASATNRKMTSQWVYNGRSACRFPGYSTNPRGSGGFSTIRRAYVIAANLQQFLRQGLDHLALTTARTSIRLHASRL